MNDSEHIRFLLDEMPEAERMAFEERLLSDGELFDRVVAAERELLDAHARGELSAEQASRVEVRYAGSPAGQRKLGFARALQALEPARLLRFPRPLQRLALAAGLAAVVVALGWWLRSGVPGPAGGPPAAPVVARVQLSAISLRKGAEPPVVELPPAAERVELMVDLEGMSAAEAFEVELRDAAGVAVWQAGGVAPVEVEWGLALLVEFSAHLLMAGEYELRLVSVSGDISAISFIVSRA